MKIKRASLPISGGTLSGNIVLSTGELQFGTDGQGILDSAGNEVLTFTAVASAINQFKMENAAASGFVRLSAEGGDTNIGMRIATKGADVIILEVNGQDDYSFGEEVLTMQNGNYITFAERTAPSAPSANRISLFAQDNGSGKTQLMALFQSGAAQQVAIEP